MGSKESGEFEPDEEELGIIGDITGKNKEGLQKLAREEKSQEFRRKTKFLRKLRKIYRKYFKGSEAETQTIEA